MPSLALDRPTKTSCLGTYSNLASARTPVGGRTAGIRRCLPFRRNRAAKANRVHTATKREPFRKPVPRFTRVVFEDSIEQMSKIFTPLESLFVERHRFTKAEEKLASQIRCIYHQTEFSDSCTPLRTEIFAQNRIVNANSGARNNRNIALCVERHL